MQICKPGTSRTAYNRAAMNSQHGHWVAIAFAAMVCACGRESENAEQPMPVEDTVFADQVETIDRAKEKAREMEGRMQDLNLQLDAAEGALRPEQSDADAGRRD